MNTDNAKLIKAIEALEAAQTYEGVTYDELARIMGHLPAHPFTAEVFAYANALAMAMNLANFYDEAGVLDYDDVMETAVFGITRPTPIQFRHAIQVATPKT